MKWWPRGKHAQKVEAKKQSAKTGRWATIRSLPRRLWARLRWHPPQDPHRSFRMTPLREQALSVGDVRTGWRLVAETFTFIKAHLALYAALGALYALFAYVLVGSISQLDYTQIKDTVSDTIGGKVNVLTSASAVVNEVFGQILQRASSPFQQFIGGVLGLFFWMAIIWATRMLMAGKKVSLQDSLYSSASPFAATTTILFILSFQLLPATLGVFIYSTALGSDWLNGGVESFMYGAATLLLVTLTAYWVISTFLATIIATLPGMRPLQAIREARVIVFGRRWKILLRVLVFLVLTMLVWLIVLVPVVAFDNWLDVTFLPIIPLFIQLLTGITLIFGSVYAYRLYRSLL